MVVYAKRSWDATNLGDDVEGENKTLQDTGMMEIIATHVIPSLILHLWNKGPRRHFLFQGLEKYIRE